MWQRIGAIEDIPTDRDLRLAVRDSDDMHELIFPCRRHIYFWIDAKTRRPVEVSPTHWQIWEHK
jgi:hypothetical protein